jgi:hypothetical protein
LEDEKRFVNIPIYCFSFVENDLDELVLLIHLPHAFLVLLFFGIMIRMEEEE